MTACKCETLIDVLGRNPRPALTFLAPAQATQSPQVEGAKFAERTELGGPVVARWLAKTINLLRELQVETLGIDLPEHWRTLIWHLAAELNGTEIRTESPYVGFVTSDAECAAEQTWEAEYVWLQALAPLALAYPGPIPAGVADAIGAVSNYPDALLQPLVADQLTTLTRAVAHAPNPDLARAGRVLIAGVDLTQVAPLIVRCWLSGLHVVWVAIAPAAADFQSVCAQVAAQEQCPAHALGHQ